MACRLDSPVTRSPLHYGANRAPSAEFPGAERRCVGSRVSREDYHSIIGRSSGIPERADTEAGFRACLAAFGSSRSAAGSRSSFLLEDWSFREQISLEKAIKVTVAAPDPLEEHRGVLHLLPHIVGEQLLQPSGDILLQIRRTCEDDV